MNISRMAFLASTAIGFVTAMPALAQSAPGATGEEIVVTAAKRSQTLLDVPASITAVSGATLEMQQASSFQEYLKLVPGLQLTQDTPGFGRLVIRGVNTGGVASTVGVYVDDTSFGSSSSLANGAILAGDFDTFDVARVEVLRGPQGTLYGANSLSGVLKFVTNAPVIGKIEARGRAGIEAVDGGDMSYYGNAVLNLPISSTMAFRASGTYRKDGGFIDTPGTPVTDGVGVTETPVARKNINGSRTYGGRAALLFQPSTALSIKLSAVLQNIDNDASSSVDANANTLATLYGNPSQTQFVPSHSAISYRVYNGLVNADLGFANLTSSSSFATLKQDFRTDATFNLSGLVATIFGPPNNLYLAQTTQVKRYTEELRLASKSGGRFEWLVGGFYSHERGLIDQAYVAVVPGTLNPITSLPLLAKVSLVSHYQEFAGFADGTFHITDKFDIDGGVRYSHNHQTADQVQDGALAGGAATYPTARSSEGVTTYSVAPKYKLNDRATVYVRVAKGFRPGGPNVLPPAAPAGTPGSFRSDSLVSYEAGFKADSADRKFSIDVSGFHIDWSNIQLFAVVNNFGINVNGAGAKSDGAEFTLTARPIPGLDLSVNGAYTDARLSGDTSSLVGGFKGDKLPFTPPWSVNVNADYRWKLTATTTAFVGASNRYLSKQNGAFDDTFRLANGRQRQIPSYDVVDLRGGLVLGRFEVEAYVRNLLNSEGKTSTAALTANGLPTLPNGAIGAGIIRPRTIGLSLTASY